MKTIIKWVLWLIHVVGEVLHAAVHKIKKGQMALFV